MTKTEVADQLDRIKQMVEKLDEAVTQLAIAVEKDEAAEKAAPAKAKTKKAEPAPAAKAPTIEDVRAALTKLASEKGASVSKQLLKDYGAEKLSDIAAQDFPELLSKVEEAMQ